jgi:hypothetical protein
MQIFKCERCGNKIMIGSFKGEVCPLDKGTLMPYAQPSETIRPIEHDSNTAVIKEKMQVLLNE